MTARRLLQLGLLLLLSTSCAWAADGTRDPAGQAAGAVEGSGEAWGGVVYAPGVRQQEQQQQQHQYAARAGSSASNQKRRPPPRYRHVKRAQAAAAPTADLAQITPAPCLQARQPQQQNDGQIQALSQQISSISSVASSASEGSRLASQSSQQLSQSVQQLAQSTQQLSRSVDDLRQSVRQAQESARAAQRSADDAMRDGIASATSSARASMSSLLAAASASARAVMSAASSQVRLAQADATLARQTAATQVAKAQGAAVSVTQAALAVVGTFIGTSLLTIGIFYLLVKRREKKKAEKRRRGSAGGYPRRHPSNSSSAPYASDDSLVHHYRPDIKEKATTKPEPVMTSALPGGLGIAQSDYGAMSGGAADARTVVIGDPPASRNRAATFSLFPRTPPAGATRPGGPGEALSPSSQYSQEGSAGMAVPSLEKWLGASQESPFGTLNSTTNVFARADSSPGWPLKREAQQQQQRPQGVGGVNAAGGAGSGGKVMRPLSRLLLRDR